MIVLLVLLIILVLLLLYGAVYYRVRTSKTRSSPERTPLPMREVIIMGRSTSQRLFQNSGTFVIQCGTSSVTIEGWGAGGGGAIFPSFELMAGGGGGSYFRVIGLPVKEGDAFDVKVGKGGLGGMFAPNPTPSDGQNGSDTVVYMNATPIVLRARGGTGATVPLDQTFAQTFPGEGGIPSVSGLSPDIDTILSDGGGAITFGANLDFDLGYGGGSPFGGVGGRSAYWKGNGVTPIAAANGSYPGGGGGGSTNYVAMGITQNTNNAGSGADGLVIVTFFA